MPSEKSILDIISQRYSCRAYQDTAIEPSLQQHLMQFLEHLPFSPFGSQVRIKLVAARDHDRRELKTLGTYGFIKNHAGFLIGAVRKAPKDMEDFGYLLEYAVLQATAMGLGTCWLGGSFTRSSFANRIALKSDEYLPAVIAVGNILDGSRAHDRIRTHAGSDHRYPWSSLFYEEQFAHPISESQAGRYAVALEMVRLAPSASNKQPWRILHQAHTWHFYLRRTPGYGGSIVKWILGSSDLQRVDLGIAMCHFELSTHELGLNGTWTFSEPGIATLHHNLEYIASWQES
jgi:nitroreductase